jgi:hypothetical protein
LTLHTAIGASVKVVAGTRAVPNGERNCAREAGGCLIAEKELIACKAAVIVSKTGTKLACGVGCEPISSFETFTALILGWCLQATKTATIFKEVIGAERAWVLNCDLRAWLAGGVDKFKVVAEVTAREGACSGARRAGDGSWVVEVACAKTALTDKSTGTRNAVSI